jgi:hypothetical protein
VKIFILNNEWMGMVRQWQELTYESRYSNSYSDSLPDFVKLADAYGWTGMRIDNLGQLEDGIKKMIETPGPVIVDCRVAQLANCFPMIPSGKGAQRDVIEQIKSQLARLVPVHRVADLTVGGAAIERELALVKLIGRGEARVDRRSVWRRPSR